MSTDTSESTTGSEPPSIHVRQSAKRADYEPEGIKAVLDANLIGHVAIIEDGWPVSIPAAIARIGEYVYLHGSRSSRLYKALAAGNPVSMSVCRVDGLVKARSAFHCSMNYRSVVLYGTAEVVSGEEKADLLDAFTERLIPGTRGQYRQHLAKELKATELLRLPLTHASAKVRNGDPIDDDEDLELSYWAGVIPLEQHLGTAVDASDLLPGIEPPKVELPE